MEKQAEFMKVKLFLGTWSEFLVDKTFANEEDEYQKPSPEWIIEKVLDEFGLDKKSLNDKYWIPFENALKNESKNITLHRSYRDAIGEAESAGVMINRFRNFIKRQVTTGAIKTNKEIPQEEEKGYNIIAQLEIPINELYYLIHGIKTENVALLKEFYNINRNTEEYIIANPLPVYFIEKLYKNVDETGEEKTTSSILKIKMGTKVANGEPVFWDPFSYTPKKLTNQHMVVVGKSGSGKTQSLASFLDELWKNKVPSLIFDFQGEYSDNKLTNANGMTFAECTNAEVLDASEGLPLNPLEIPIDVKAGKPQSFVKVVYQLSKTLAKIFGLGDIQAATLQKAIFQSYQDKGFKVDDKETWDNTPPTMFDVWDLIQAEDAKNTSGLILRIKPLFETGVFRKGESSSLDRIYNQTSILQLGGLATTELMVAVSSFFLQKVYMNMLAAGQSETISLMLVIDEAHKLSYNETITTLIREARKYGVGLLLASQGLKDFDPVIVNMVGTKIAMQLDSEDAKAFSYNIGITAKEDYEKIQTEILQEEPFQGIMVNNQYMPYILMNTVPFFRKG